MNGVKVNFITKICETMIYIVSIALKETKKVPVTIKGFELTGNRIKTFLNELNKQVDRYLECGVYCGVTFCSAIYGNDHLKAIAIDSWAERFNLKHGHPRDLFLENVETFRGKTVINLIQSDHWAVKELPFKPQVYFYDGAHDALSQEKALTHYGKMCEDTFIFVVDDYNRKEVKDGTARGLQHFEVLYSLELGNSMNDSEGWWCGIAVFVLKQKR